MALTEEIKTSFAARADECERERERENGHKVVPTTGLQAGIRSHTTVMSVISAGESEQENPRLQQL